MQAAPLRTLTSTQRHSAAKPQPNHAKRLECVELAPAFKPLPPYDSASKLDALHTLRVAVHTQQPSQLENNLDDCSPRPKPQPTCAKRFERVELAPALEPPHVLRQRSCLNTGQTSAVKPRHALDGDAVALRKIPPQNTKRIRRKHEGNTKGIRRQHASTSKTTRKHLPSNRLAHGLQLACIWLGGSFP
jgi:hypothetical protein